MMFRYVRFRESVASPGYAGSDISTAKLRSTADKAAIPREQLMDLIEVRGPFLVLMAIRKVPQPSGPPADRAMERWIPLTNVRDLEPLEIDAPPEPKPKGNAR